MRKEPLPGSWEKGIVSIMGNGPSVSREHKLVSIMGKVGKGPHSWQNIFVNIMENWPCQCHKENGHINTLKNGILCGGIN